MARKLWAVATQSVNVSDQRGHRRPSEAIRGHQRPSEAIRGHQRPSEGIRGHQKPSEVIRGRPSNLKQPSIQLLVIDVTGAVDIKEVERALEVGL